MNDEHYRKEMIRNSEISRKLYRDGKRSESNNALRLALNCFHEIKRPTQDDFNAGLAMAIAVDDEA